jgi:hypothetical protein
VIPIQNTTPHAWGAAARRDALQCKRYAADSDGLPYAFVPFTVETFGRLGGPAMDHLSALREIAVASLPPGADVAKGRFIDDFLRELVVSLAHGNDLVVRRFLGFTRSPIWRWVPARSRRAYR